jgi:hypothetical protein
VPNRSLCLMEVWNLLEVSRGSAGATLSTTTNDKPFAEFRASFFPGWEHWPPPPKRQDRARGRANFVGRNHPVWIEKRHERAPGRRWNPECLSHLDKRDPAAWPTTVVPDPTRADLLPNNDSSFSSIILIRSPSDACENMTGQSPIVSGLFASISFLLTNS